MRSVLLSWRAIQDARAILRKSRATCRVSRLSGGCGKVRRDFVHRLDVRPRISDEDTVGVTVFRDFGGSRIIWRSTKYAALMCVIGIAKHFAGAAILARTHWMYLPQSVAVQFSLLILASQSSSFTSTPLPRLHILVPNPPTPAPGPSRSYCDPSEPNTQQLAARKLPAARFALSVIVVLLPVMQAHTQALASCIIASDGSLTSHPPSPAHSTPLRDDRPCQTDASRITPPGRTRCAPARYLPFCICGRTTSG